MLTILTFGHTAIRVLAILTGLVVLRGLIQSRGRVLWTLAFLSTAALTTLTGFFFPFQGPTPAFVLGIISIVPISLAFVARYRFAMAGGWRGAYVVTTVVTLYFNVFVLIVQAFRHLPPLHALAPTQTEPAFGLAQLAALALFTGLGVAAFRKFHSLPLGQQVDFPQVGVGATRYKSSAQR